MCASNVSTVTNKSFLINSALPTALFPEHCVEAVFSSHALFAIEYEYEDFVHEAEIPVFTVNEEVYGKATPELIEKVIEEYKNK